jgi:hypothetical protein
VRGGLGEGIPRSELRAAPSARGGCGGGGSFASPCGEVGNNTGTGVRRDPLGGTRSHSQGVRRPRDRAAAPAAVHPGSTPVPGIIAAGAQGAGTIVVLASYPKCDSMIASANRSLCAAKEPIWTLRDFSKVKVGRAT